MDFLFEQWSAPFQNEYGYRVQYSNNQFIIAFLKRLAGSMFKFSIRYCTLETISGFDIQIIKSFMGLKETFKET